MTSSFTPDPALSFGRIDRMRVRCITVNLGRLRITSGLSAPLLFHAIWDCTSTLSFSVATRATTRALPPRLRGVCWSTGLLYRPPWWQLILLICHRLIDSCHYSVCKRRKPQGAFNYASVSKHGLSHPLGAFQRERERHKSTWIDTEAISSLFGIQRETKTDTSALICITCWKAPCIYTQLCDCSV